MNPVSAAFIDQACTRQNSAAARNDEDLGRRLPCLSMMRSPDQIANCETSISTLAHSLLQGRALGSTVAKVHVGFRLPPASGTCNVGPSVKLTDRSIKFSSCLTLPGQSEFMRTLIVSAGILSMCLFMRRANVCTK